MATRPFSEREVLPYLVLFVILYTAASSFPATDFNIWDGAIAAGSILLAVVGTIYIYRQNGGAKGEHFLQRYFALGWVVTVRFFVILVIAAIILGALGILAEKTSAFEFLFVALAQAVFYWRIGHHVGDLARRKPVV